MSGWGSATAAVVALAGTGMSMVAQQQQAQQQKASAEYSAKIAENNKELADDQAAAVKRQGYDDAQRKRAQTAGIIGTQRAIAGASGATVDTGSNLDMQLDTAEKGEIDALGIQQQSLDKARNLQIQGWNYDQQAQGYSWKADNLDPTVGMIGTALNGLASAGKNFGSNLWGAKKATPKSGTPEV